MATLLSVGDFPEEEFWTMVSETKKLPSGSSLLDYDGIACNNYLKEGDTKYFVLADEFNVAEANLLSPISRKMKTKLVYWVSYCICRDAQDGKAIPLFDNKQEDKIDWWKVKKEDYLSLYNSVELVASDVAIEVDDTVNSSQSVCTISRTS